MSAFICDNKTITAIARAFVEYGVEFRGGEPKSAMDMILVDTNKETKRIGQALLAENYRSVNYRYSEETEVPEFEPERLEKLDQGIVTGCIACYEYQACETDDWEETLIYKDLQKLKQKILYSLLRGYNMQVPYGYGGHNMMED